MLFEIGSILFNAALKLLPWVLYYEAPVFMNKFYYTFPVTICGSYRRGKESSGDIDCLITHPSYTSAESKKSKLIHEKMLKQVVKKLTDIGLVTDTIALGHTKFMVKNSFL